MGGQDIITRTFPGRVGLQQRVLPAYRAPLFDMLAESCAGGLSVFAGQPLPGEGIVSANHLKAAGYAAAHNRHFTHPGSPFYYCWQSDLLDWLEDWQPDALIVEANPRYPSTRLAVRWMHSRSRPVLGWGLGAPRVPGALGYWRRWMRRSLVKSLDGIIAYSRRGAAEYEALGLPAERIFVAANAVAARPKAPPPERPPGFRGRPVVLFIGRLQARKRIDNLLRACAALPEGLQPRLDIVGDGPARGDFQALAKELYPDAEFMGALYGPELEAHFVEADLFVLPGTGGLAVQQAMAYGLPVIVAEGDGTQGDLARPDAGWLVPPDDLTALTDALLEALVDPQRLRRMGAAARRIVDQEVNLEAIVDTFVQALVRVME